MAPAVFLALVLAQGAPAEAADPAQLERIRKALSQAPAIALEPPTRSERSVFRMTVRSRTPDPPMWDGWSAAPTYVRPWFHADHYEYLERVTTEEFRSMTLNPVGVPVVQVVQLMVKGIKAVTRKKREADARNEVRQALADLLACRENPNKPGCSLLN